jgi:rsbT co-antagonist protein RsbR
MANYRDPDPPDTFPDQPTVGDSFRAALLESITESTLDGIHVVDTRGRALSANRRFTEMWRIPAEVVASRDDDRMLACVLEQLADADAFLAKVRHLYAHPDESSRDLISFKDGRVFDRFSTPLRDRIGRLLGRVWYFRDVTDTERLREVQLEKTRLQEELIEQQRRALRALSTPLIPITDDVLVMPLIGEVDSERAAQILDRLATGVGERRTRVALLDLTGVSTLDTQFAAMLGSAAGTARLLGAEVVITGIQPKMAQVLTRLGVNLGGVVTRSTLQAGISYALAGAAKPGLRTA